MLVVVSYKDGLLSRNHTGFSNERAANDYVAHLKRTNKKSIKIEKPFDKSK